METGTMIVNRVEASGLVTLNLEDFYPKETIKVFDLKDYLFRGLIIREKDFREALKNTNWQDFENIVALCKKHYVWRTLQYRSRL